MTDSLTHPFGISPEAESIMDRIAETDRRVSQQRAKTSAAFNMAITVVGCIALVAVVFITRTVPASAHTDRVYQEAKVKW